MTGVARPQVLLASAEPGAARNWGRLIYQWEAMQLVTVHTRPAALIAASSTRFDGALVHARLPGGDAVDVVREVRRRRRHAALAVVTRSPVAASWQNALSEAGAFLLREPFEGSALGHWIVLAQEALRFRALSLETLEDAPRLSARERQCLELALIGVSSADTASRLGVSVATARTYTARALRKLGLRRISELRALLERDGR